MDAGSPLMIGLQDCRGALGLEFVVRELWLSFLLSLLFCNAIINVGEFVNHKNRDHGWVLSSKD